MITNIHRKKSKKSEPRKYRLSTFFLRSFGEFSDFCEFLKWNSHFLIIIIIVININIIIIIILRSIDEIGFFPRPIDEIHKYFSVTNWQIIFFLSAIFWRHLERFPSIQNSWVFPLPIAKIWIFLCNQILIFAMFFQWPV